MSLQKITEYQCCQCLDPILEDERVVLDGSALWCPKCTEQERLRTVIAKAAYKAGLRYGKFSEEQSQ